MSNCTFLLRNLLLFVTCTISALPVFAQEVPKGSIKVGAILGLTGDWASVGEAVRNGILLAYNNLPKAEQQNIQLVFEDDSSSAAGAVSAFNKLKDTQSIDVAVAFSSSSGKALGPMADKSKIPLIAIATDPQVVKGRNYVVNFFTTAEEEVRVLRKEVEKRGYKKIARICTTHDFPLSVKRVFDEENKGLVQVVLDEEYAQSNKDFKAYITKLKAQTDIDGVFVGLMPGQVGLFAKELRDLGVKTPLFGIEIFEDSNEVKVSQGALVGQWYINADDPNDDFFKTYKAAYPNASLYGAAHGYDIVLLIAAAVKQGNSPGAINKFLHTVKDFKGALGTYSASGDNRFTLPAAVKVVTLDGFKKL